tara:strand:+ start:337 stop:969 length:633 start_codon:yes stop_codon:yes gene_type:complete
MANLAELLTQASPDDATALTQARAYTEQVLKNESDRMITERRMIDLLGFTAGDIAMTAIENAPTTIIPARIKTWFKPSELGVDIAAPYGLELVRLMIQYNTVTQAQADKLTGYAYRTEKPFEFVTLHDIKLARENCPTKPVTQVNGWVVIETTAVTENHNPRLLVDNQRTGKRIRINNFISVSAIGKYDAQVPAEWRNSDLFVDDAYGAL